MYSQVIISIFILFFLSRVFLRFKDQTISGSAIVGWTVFWVAVATVVWQPGLSDKLALIFGIRRGTDVVIIASILALFYALFRTYVQFEMLEREVTRLVRAMALKNEWTDDEKAPSNDTSLLS